MKMLQQNGTFERSHRSSRRFRTDDPVVASRRQAAPGGTRSGSRASGRAADAAVQIVRGRTAGATETADRASRP